MQVLFSCPGCRAVATGELKQVEDDPKSGRITCLSCKTVIRFQITLFMEIQNTPPMPYTDPSHN